ncbi:choline/ethanolamine kinase isoform X2 [Harpegnathos saltator]|uniref:Choline/ethanolamine kinase n=2 Tax=Harpegnathos saltator TaxID=610380 RepID=E2BGW1_HARSA|nr:choline/ethanolamine kinase isoform X2 [Harpegnathos saltator]EFN85093.1 Choline/ethanolamine kinase [Harpegnathos saltator]
MSEKNSEMRETAARICRDYLHGVWKHITAQNIILKRISGGLSNWLYNVQLPEGTTPVRGEPRQVLLRLYGQVHGERALEGLITESVIFTLLSERKLGPKLHGVFPGGRIEEYIPARPLLTKELSDPTLSLMIAEKLAQIHRMQVPISKEPTWLWDTMNKWLKSTTDILENIGDIDVQHSDNVNAIKCIDLEHEIKWLKTLVLQQKLPVVFCHNDMQEGNILLRENMQKPELVVIDFEYCSYNYQGFDIANHFVEWQYNYTTPNYPFFHELLNAGPTREQKLNFIRSYLRALGKEGAAEEERIMKEMKMFSLASHLFWGLWSIINVKISQIPFGYWDYAASRLKNYMYLKEKMLTSGSPVSDGSVKRKSTDID